MINIISFLFPFPRFDLKLVRLGGVRTSFSFQGSLVDVGLFPLISCACFCHFGGRLGNAAQRGDTKKVMKKVMKKVVVEILSISLREKGG